MLTGSLMRFGAQTDEVTSLLRIVNMVRTREATTRPEIGRLTGLGRGVVSQRIDLATKHGLLAEGEMGHSTGGRAPRTLRFRSERGLILVCAFGAGHIHVGVAHLDGDIVAQRHEVWDIAKGPRDSLRTGLRLAREVLEQRADIPLWAAAVGLPGPVDFGLGRPVSPPIMPGWDDYDVRGHVEAELGVPVWVDNDVNLLAQGERARHASEPIDLIYCKVGTGIGTGLLSRGRLHRGATGAAGDIAHVRATARAVPCRCGKAGCLEAVAGGWALVRDTEEALRSGATSTLTEHTPGRLSPIDIARAAESGDALATRLLQESARAVGDALADLVNLFNPAVIVIGGAVAAAGQTYVTPVNERVLAHSLPLSTRGLRIECSKADPGEPLRGGVELVREQLFEVSFAHWFLHGRPTRETVGPAEGLSRPRAEPAPSAPASR